MQQFLNSLNRYSLFPLTRPFRIPVLVNLDPANEFVPYASDVSVTELVDVASVMAEQELGPNGALLYCFEVLEQRIDWLLEKLAPFAENSYFIFDLPGQVELTTCNSSLLSIIKALRKHDYRLTVVHLADAAYCSDPSKYIAMLITTLKSMMQLECSQVNVLSKLDLIESYGQLPLRLEYFLNVQDLHYLLSALGEGSIGKKYQQLSAALCELIEDSGLLSFVPLAIEDKECMAFLLGEIDKANGHVFGTLTAGNESIMEVAVTQAHREKLIEIVTDRYMASFDDPQFETVN